ncbi:trhR [Salmonella enterica]|nr:trhR [Salmonella enterica]EEX1005138.1 trhR [Escherichia coli]
MSDSDNLTHSLLSRLFRTEISIIRSYRAFLMLLPVHGSSTYQTGTPLLQKRLFCDTFGYATDSAFEIEKRPGSLLVPRSSGREVSWEKFLIAILEGDSNIIRGYDPTEMDSGIYRAGEKVTFLNGTTGVYNPEKVQELRTKCVDIQNDYFMQIFFCSMMSPEFVSVYFGLKPDVADCIKDIGVSSLKQINDVVLFPRTIPFVLGHTDDSASISSKVYAWAYEIASDVKLGIVSDELIELLRYDTLFTSHRQDVFNSLANKITLKDY